MKQWLSARVDFIDHQLVPPPAMGRENVNEGGQPGYRFLLTVPNRSTNRVIYYTVDGSDPRLPQGGISPQAKEFTEPVLLTAETVITARTRDPQQRQTGGPPISTPWSGAVSRRFTKPTP